VTREALGKINITSRGWEYASEMVLKAARLNLVSSEVPIKFYKDRAGRFSHHRRVGWRSSWSAGWVNLKVMLVYAADSFLLNPGIVLMAIGLCFAASRLVRSGLERLTGFNGCSGDIQLLVTFHPDRHPGARCTVASPVVERGPKNFTLIADDCVSWRTRADACLQSDLSLFETGLNIDSHPAILAFCLLSQFQTFCFTLLMEMAKRVIPTFRQALIHK
jgi:hypothetical protein